MKWFVKVERLCTGLNISWNSTFSTCFCLHGSGELSPSWGWEAKGNHFQLRCHVLWAGKLRASWKLAIARGNDLRQRTADHYKVAIKCQIRSDWPTLRNGVVPCPLIQLNGLIIKLGGAAERSGTNFCVIGDIARRAGQPLSANTIRNMIMQNRSWQWISSDCPRLHWSGAGSSLHGEIDNLHRNCISDVHIVHIVQMTFDRDSPKVSLTCVFDERQFDCGTTFLSTANPALVVGDKVGLLMVEMINMISVADEMEMFDPLFFLQILRILPSIYWLLLWSSSILYWVVT